MSQGNEGARGRRLLVVDDEADIAAMLEEYFALEGYEVVVAHSGAEALDAVAASVRAADADDAEDVGGASPAHANPAAIDAILLDVNMPDMDGFEVCRRVRSYLACPIIFLTARIEDMDQIDGFAAGADDYVLKPFSLEVLGRRVAAHLAREQRRTQGDAPAGAVRFFGPVTIDYARREVTVSAEGERVPVELTRTEFDIVALLSKRPGQVFDRDAIYQRVWGWNALGDPTIIREHIRRIRRKLADAGVGERCIETAWGAGYKWVAR